MSTPKAVGADPGDADPLALALFGLTVVSGLIDAVSYLGLGHVFAANMTGNVVVIGFGLAGAPGFSVLGSTTALAAFLLGAALAGRLTAGRLRPALVAEGVLHLAAAAVVFGVGTGAVGTGGAVQYGVIGLLALAMGLRNATVRSLGVPDLTTTVLTMTLTGLAAEPRSPRRRRRVLAALTMLAGVVPGAVLVLHRQTGWALVAAAALTGATAALHRD